MTDAISARDGRVRQWLLDAALGGGLAFALMTAANASLPRAPLQTIHLLPVIHVAPPMPPPSPPALPPQPPALIAFQDPVPGYPVGSAFGMRQMPWEEHGRLHAGVDIDAPAGTPILASADGVVTRIGQDAGYGRFVELKHAEGMATLYAHMGGFAPGLAEGAALKAGAPVGRIGSTGSSTGAHLHFEVHDPEGRPLNPELFLGRRFARADELPLRAASRVARHVHVAYVSAIPRARREEMEAKADEAVAEKAAADASAVTSIAGGAGSGVVAGTGMARPRAHYQVAR